MEPSAAAARGEAAMRRHLDKGFWWEQDDETMARDAETFAVVGEDVRVALRQVARQRIDEKFRRGELPPFVAQAYAAQLMGDDVPSQVENRRRHWTPP